MGIENFGRSLRLLRTACKVRLGKVEGFNLEDLESLGSECVTRNERDSEG